MSEEWDASLRREIRYLQDINAEVDRLRAEIVRLEDRWTRIAKELIDVNALNEELVEVLQEAYQGWTVKGVWRDRARAALAKAR